MFAEWRMAQRGWEERHLEPDVFVDGVFVVRYFGEPARALRGDCIQQYPAGPALATRDWAAWLGVDPLPVAQQGWPLERHCQVPQVVDVAPMAAVFAEYCGQAGRIERDSRCAEADHIEVAGRSVAQQVELWPASGVSQRAREEWAELQSFVVPAVLPA